MYIQMNVINLNKNIPLFRANSTNGKMTNRNYAYFIFGEDAVNLVTNQYAKIEGNKIHQYKLSKPLTLLYMGDVKTINFLKSKDPSVEYSINKTFRIRNGQVIRKSKLEYDLKVAKLICKLGYDGYYAPPLPKKYGTTTFHQEIMLCKPMDKVNYINSIVPFKPLKPISLKNFNNSNYKFEESPRKKHRLS